MKLKHLKTESKKGEATASKWLLEKLGIEAWRADESTTITISVNDLESSGALDDRKVIKEAQKVLAKLYKVHPNDVEFDRSTPEFNIVFEKNHYSKYSTFT